MKRSVVVIFIFLTMLLAQFTLAQNQWSVSSKQDPMTGKVTWFAVSPPVSSIEKMSFPYEDTKAQLVIARQGREEWVYIAFNKEPNIVGGIIEGRYEIITTRIKWDNLQPVYVKLVQEAGLNSLHFEKDQEIIRKIIIYKKLLVELNWYGEGLVHFEFPLEGAASAIAQIRRK
ncbi:MAG: hypothetical protein WHT65_03330 [Pseudothermotoga sp.]